MASDSRPWWERVFNDVFSGSLPWESTNPVPHVLPPSRRLTQVLRPPLPVRAFGQMRAAPVGQPRFHGLASSWRPSPASLAFVKKVTQDGSSFRRRRAELAQANFARLTCDPKAGRARGRKSKARPQPPGQRLALTLLPSDGQRRPAQPAQFGTPSPTVRAGSRLPVQPVRGSGGSGSVIIPTADGHTAVLPPRLAAARLGPLR